MKSDKECPRHGRSAIAVMMVVFGFGFALLAVRLKTLQIDEAADIDLKYERQSIRRVRTTASRGRILDATGKVLAENHRRVSILLNPVVFQAKTWERTIGNICEAITNAAAVIGMDELPEVETVHRYVMNQRSVPLVVWKSVNELEAARFAEHGEVLPGFELSESFDRVYPYGSTAAHLLGYVGRDLNVEHGGYRFYEPDMSGRSGLERLYDSYLRGMPGERRVVVDARCFARQVETVLPAKSGLDLKLTIDLDIQRSAEAQLAGLCGAVVVLNSRTGAVVAMASSPSFDPNDFVPYIPTEVYRQYIENSAYPLLCRATGGVYAPGSVFKPITALAALREGVPSSLLFDCAGSYSGGGIRIHCARRWGHGELDLQHALRESCNPYFCYLAADIGTNALYRAAREFGFGAKTGIDFMGELQGSVPSAELKQRRYGTQWGLADLLQSSIGQGMLTVTPLQMAVAIGGVQQGYLVRPFLRSDSEIVRKQLAFTAEQFEIVREGMRMVVDVGTGRRGGEGVLARVIGKTGTAEVGSRRKKRKNTWFVAAAWPDATTRRHRQLEVAVALVVEDGDSGGGTAAPKVANILKTIYGKRSTAEVVR